MKFLKLRETESINIMEVKNENFLFYIIVLKTDDIFHLVIR